MPDRREIEEQELEVVETAEFFLFREEKFLSRMLSRTDLLLSLDLTLSFLAISMSNSPRLTPSFEDLRRRELLEDLLELLEPGRGE